jgi:hypothetical protein
VNRAFGVSLTLLVVLGGCTDLLRPNSDFDQADLVAETVVVRRVFYRDHAAPVPVEISSLVVDRIDFVARGTPRDRNRVALIHTDASSEWMRELHVAVGDSVRISTRFLYVGDMYVSRRDIPGWGSGSTHRGPIHESRALEPIGGPAGSATWPAMQRDSGL